MNPLILTLSNRKDQTHYLSEEEKKIHTATWFLCGLLSWREHVKFTPMSTMQICRTPVCLSPAHMQHPLVERDIQCRKTELIAFQWLDVKRFTLCIGYFWHYSKFDKWYWTTWRHRTLKIQRKHTPPGCLRWNSPKVFGRVMFHRWDGHRAASLCVHT